MGTTSWDSSRLALLMLRTLPPRVARPPWPSWRTRFTSLRPSLPAPRLALERPPRRSPPSTWPSSGRPSRSWSRSRSAPSLPPSSKPCQIRAQDDQLKLEENLPSWKLQPLNPICEDPEVGQTLSELLLRFPKPFLSPLIFSSNPIWFSGTLISVSSPTININH